jgi:hypothetical protein
MTDNENKTNSEWKNRELGALWKKDGKSQKFYSGFVKVNKDTSEEKEIPIVIFLNKLKKNPKAPDLIIYQSKEMGPSTDHDQIPDSFLE